MRDGIHRASMRRTRARRGLSQRFPVFIPGPVKNPAALSGLRLTVAPSLSPSFASLVSGFRGAPVLFDLAHGVTVLRFSLPPSRRPLLRLSPVSGSRDGAAAAVLAEVGAVIVDGLSCARSRASFHPGGRRRAPFGSGERCCTHTAQGIN